jgi:hypothetical protein
LLDFFGTAVAMPPAVTHQPDGLMRVERKGVAFALSGIEGTMVENAGE